MYSIHSLFRSQTRRWGRRATRARSSLWRRRRTRRTSPPRCRAIPSPSRPRVASSTSSRGAFHVSMLYPDLRIRAPIYTFRASVCVTHPHHYTRCNEYNLKDYLPVYVGDEPVGYAHLDFVSELTLLQQGGWACMLWLVDFRDFFLRVFLSRTPKQHPQQYNTTKQVRACAWRWTATWSWPPAPTLPRSARGKTCRSRGMSCVNRSMHAWTRGLTNAPLVLLCLSSTG